ncbi:MAG: neutral/alkaline non-lysosomal ceramidase N-terminal domain-containing protein [Planctomycetes bacterium]|nr:neutral/alkaline non-lysosomal ceramidase N-terminal domain-containing protein [Planctomycetota bacterium]
MKSCVFASVRLSRWTRILVLCGSLMVAAPGAGATESGSAGLWKAGVARVIITPQEPMWMAGYGARDKPAEGKLQDLYAKALALEGPDGARLVLVTTDLVGLPAKLTESIAGSLRDQYGLVRSQIMFTSSHTHSGPLLAEEYPVYPVPGLSPQEQEKVHRYTQGLPGRLVQVVSDALADLAPARLAWGIGRAGFAVNRREPTAQGFINGANPAGPVDHNVPVLRVESPEGRLRAVAFGYACHNTTLSDYQWCGDYAGYAQEVLEAAHGGATALFFMGCGADANPLPRRTVELCQKYGGQLAEAVEAVLRDGMHPVAGPVRVAFTRVDLPLDRLPTREELAERAGGKPSYAQRRAAWLLQILEKQGRFDTTYPFPIQTWQLGSDLTWIALGGEAVVDYSLRLKRELGPATWVAAYANDVMEYIPSRRVLKEGGYEAEIFSADLAGAAWEPSIEERIVSEVHQQVAAVRGGTPPAGYRLVWSDEFDGTALDLSKWSYRGLGRRRDALNVADAVSVGDGRLTITTYTAEGKHCTGMIGTEGKFEQRFGYWEARIRFDGAPGMWSAFWIQTPAFGRPPNDPATAGMEIDVMEHRVSDRSGQDISGPAHHALHIGGGKSQSHVTEDLKLGRGFHTYGVLWTETEYRFFVDGKLTWTAAPVSKRPEYLILSSEIQDQSWAGTIPAGGYGPRPSSQTRMVVDYVRFFAP